MIDKDEKWTVLQVNPDKVVCKTCKFKNGGMRYPHYTKGSCEVYPHPQTKPDEVLFKGADCEFYEKE